MTVDLISHSPCWKDTVIFVVEDDTQNGFDHVDGSRRCSFTSTPNFAPYNTTLIALTARPARLGSR
jgi:hypothetical protein